MSKEFNHIHLEECESTQLYLKEFVESSEFSRQNYLVSTSNQINGIGRRGHKWDSLGNDLAFSFLIDTSNTPSLTPLELAVILHSFFESRFNVSLQLKWPNDLILNGQKCGGIIIHLVNEIAIVGVGLNLGKKIDSTTKDYQSSSIFEDEDLKSSQLKSIPADIYNFVLNNRITDLEIISNWTKKSFHLNKMVTIKDGDKEVEGHFVGIGKSGEAIIKSNEGEIKNIFSGSLFVK